MKYYIPINLDIDKLILENPPKIKNFRSDKLILILDLINTIPAANKDLVTWNGYVPIQATILQRSIVGYKKYLTYLIEQNIILCDNYFIKGVKSIGYMFASEYEVGLKTVSVDKIKPLMAEFRKINKLTIKLRKKYKYILKFYNRNLKIDFQLSKKYLYNDLELKLNNPELNESAVSYGKPKNPNVQYNAALVNIEKNNRR